MSGSSLTPLDRKAAIAFATALVILLSVTLFAYRGIVGLDRAIGLVDQTHQVIEALDVVERRLGEAESAQRGYLLGADPRYRNAHDRAALAVHGALARARSLTVDNPEQHRRLDTLEALAATRLAELRRMIRMTDERGLEAAHDAMRVERATSAMPAFEVLCERMRDAERGLLSVRNAERAARLERLPLAMLLGAVAALLIALLAAVRVARLVVERVAVERERDGHALELAMQSTELSAQNEELIAQGEALQMAMELADEANQAKSAFLAQMSHELRTPLNSVIGFANIVRRNPRGTLEESEITYLDRVVENGRHLLRTINSILDLSKIEAHQETVELELIALDELAREVIATLEPQAAAAQIALRLESPPVVAPLVTDCDKLRRVLINLVANAVKFTKAGGSVTVCIETAAESRVPLALEVRDTGIGIAPNRLAAIFEAFEQGDVGVGREYGGTGLGLSISRALCRLLHYELTVTSTLGVGSTFRVALAGAEPRRADAAAPPAQLLEPAPR